VDNVVAAGGTRRDLLIIDTNCRHFEHFGELLEQVAQDSCSWPGGTGLAGRSGLWIESTPLWPPPSASPEKTAYGPYSQSSTATRQRQMAPPPTWLFSLARRWATTSCALPCTLTRISSQPPCSGCVKPWWRSSPTTLFPQQSRAGNRGLHVFDLHGLASSPKVESRWPFPWDRVYWRLCGSGFSPHMEERHFMLSFTTCFP
jgi:hypothetical protein